jgi:DNA polymerase-3 subunit chi
VPVSASVDFYVVDNADERGHDVFFCRLINQCWQEGHAVHVHTRDQAHAEYFDDLLWTFHDISFIPHESGWQNQGASVAPVTIGFATAHARHQDLVVNLGAALPAGLARFTRILETAGVAPAARADARTRYRTYQDQGFSLRTHKISL